MSPGNGSTDSTRRRNVFVLGSGRTGTVTLSVACSHIRNYTSAHESRVSEVGPGRLHYPPGHIEIDNRLSWFLGRLEREYGDDAVYVHMIRERESTARSYAGRFWPGSLPTAFARGIYLYLPEQVDRLALSLDLVDTANANVEAFLRGKTRTMTFSLEHARRDFELFWKLIDAEGDFDAALCEWDHRSNSSDEAPRGRRAAPGAASTAPRSPGRLVRAVRKARRVVGGLPGYICHA